MFVTGDPVEKRIALESLSIKDIDNLIEALNTIKQTSLENIEKFKNERKNHIPDAAELQGAVGYHPKEEFVQASAEIDINGSEMKLLLVSKKASDLHDDITMDGDTLEKAIDLAFGADDEPDKIEDMPDEYTYFEINPSQEKVEKKSVNLSKANLIIEKMHNDDDDNLISVGIDWKPFGGTYVVHIMDRYFISEMNLYGVSAKEISKKLYKCILEEINGD